MESLWGTIERLILINLGRVYYGISTQEVEVFKEHEQIVLTADIFGDEGVELKSGDVGTIIHIHPDEEALVVEFMPPNGDTVAIATVLPSQARLVTNANLTHSRTVLPTT